MLNILLEMSGEIANEEAEPKQKQCPVVDVTGDGSKVRCCKEQYCKGTWNIMSNEMQRNPESRQIESGQIGDDKSEHRYFRNQ